MYSTGDNEKKKYTVDGLITPTRKTVFEDSDVEDNEEVGFDPPPVIDADVLTQTPVIRLTTPIREKRQKEEKVEDEFDIPEIKDEEPIPTVRPSPRRPISVPSSPVLDISDADDVNERISELISFPGDQEYSKETKVVKEGCMEAFKIKYDNLKLNYPDLRVEFPEGKKLERVHKIYHSYIKSIYVNMNLDQIQLGYVMCLMVFEFIAIKAFGIPMAGFTKMELKRMYRYNQLMIELGESFYTSGGGPGGGGVKTSLEYRIGTSFLWNIVVFLGVKLLTKYMGGESMTGLIRGAIDKIMDNPVTVDNIENGTATQMQEEDGLNGLLDDVMGNGSNITEILANLGTNFTEKMESSNTRTSTTGKKGDPKKKRRVIFNE